MRKSDICLWVAAVPAALIAFSAAIMAVGYQPLSAGRVGTMAFLAVVAAGALAMRARFKKKGE